MRYDRNIVSRSLILAILISLASILVILYFTVTDETLKSLFMIRPVFLLAAITLHILSWVVWGVKIKVLSRITGNHLRLFDTVRIVMASAFTAAITPSHAGGEPVRIYLLSKSVNIGDATAIIFCERFLDLLFLILLSPFGLYIFKGILFRNFEIYAFFCLGFLMFIVILTLVVLTLYHPGGFISRLYRIISFIKGEKKARVIMDKVEKNLEAFIRSMKRFIREGRRELAGASICTVIFWSMEFFIPPLILMGLGSSPQVVYAFVAQVILMMLVLIPVTPGGSGIAELGFTALFSFFVRPSILGVLVVLWRFITYYLNIIAGGLAGLSFLRTM